VGDDATGRVVELAAVTGRIAAVREATRTSPLGRYRAGQQQAQAVLDARDALALTEGEGGATHAFTGGFYREAGLDVEGFMELGHSPTSLERDDTTPTGAQGMRRVGKKAAGRALDGCTHDAYPAGA